MNNGLGRLDSQRPQCQYHARFRPCSLQCICTLRCQSCSSQIEFPKYCYCLNKPRRIQMLSTHIRNNEYSYSKQMLQMAWNLLCLRHVFASLTTAGDVKTQRQDNIFRNLIWISFTSQPNLILLLAKGSISELCDSQTQTNEKYQWPKNSKQTVIISCWRFQILALENTEF